MEGRFHVFMDSPSMVQERYELFVWFCNAQPGQDDQLKNNMVVCYDQNNKPVTWAELLTVHTKMGLPAKTWEQLNKEVEDYESSAPVVVTGSGRLNFNL